MPPFKIKFTAHPQHDAEGFTVMDAKCRGCEPTEMCPRSGHCERYMSPLRDVYGIAADMIDIVTDLGVVTVQRTNLDYSNPRLNRRIGVSAALGMSYGKSAVKLSEMTDAELNDVHSDWLRRGRAE